MQALLTNMDIVYEKHIEEGILYTFIILYHLWFCELVCACYRNSDHIWSDSGIRVLAGSLASISAAGILCDVSVCVVTFT